MFSGQKKDFPMWWSKFQAYAGMKKISKAITAQGEGLPAQADESIDKSEETGKEMMKKIERNSLAMHAFTLAFKTHKLMNIVNKAKTDEWPDEKASDVTKQLLKKYKQDDKINIVKMTAELVKVKIGETKDPAELFEELYKIKNMYSTASNKVNDETLIPYMLAGAPNKYHGIITSKMRSVRRL